MGTSARKTATRAIRYFTLPDKPALSTLRLLYFLHTQLRAGYHEMKFRNGIFAVLGFSTADPLLKWELQQPGLGQGREMGQLFDMMEHYNSNDDVSNYWFYGCNCHFLNGNLAESQMGYGVPVDALDEVCKTYNNCIKCVRDVHHDTCTDEYGMDIAPTYKYGERQGDLICQDGLGSCERSVCECDLAFAKAHVSEAYVYNQDYHEHESTLPGGWNPSSNCVQDDENPSVESFNPQCCGVPSEPYVIYNAAIHSCTDGIVVD